MMTIIFVLVIVVAGWSLVVGLRYGEMSAMGVPYGTYRRSNQPILFWLAASFNLMLLVVGVLLAIEELIK